MNMTSAAKKSSLLLHAYRVLTSLISPLLYVFIQIRRLRGKEDAVRLRERFGHPAYARPEGVLIWVHAASVGEMMSCLHLIKALSSKRPDATLMLTTGTVSSARMAQSKLPEGVLHHYMPIDTPASVARFQSHFRPNLVLWVESELWPNHLENLRREKIPVLLINARMSVRSARRWALFPNASRQLLSTFTAVYAGSDADAARFARLQAQPLYMTGNIKYDAPALQADATALNALTELFRKRPIWCAASTHEGEDAIILDAHKRIAHTIPDVLTIIAPRHPQRAASIVKFAASQQLYAARRSLEETVEKTTALYLADTMGELGNLFRLCDIIFVGGSLVARGGHNPIEPARLNCALITGPHTYNFTDIYAHFTAALAVEIVKDAASLASAVCNLMLSLDLRNERAHAASAVVAAQAGATRNILKHALQLLPLAPTET